MKFTFIKRTTNFPPVLRESPEFRTEAWSTDYDMILRYYNNRDNLGFLVVDAAVKCYIAHEKVTNFN